MEDKQNTNSNIYSHSKIDIKNIDQSKYSINYNINSSLNIKDDNDMTDCDNQINNITNTNLMDTNIDCNIDTLIKSNINTEPNSNELNSNEINSDEVDNDFKDQVNIKSNSKKLSI